MQINRIRIHYLILTVTVLNSNSYVCLTFVYYWFDARFKLKKQHSFSIIEQIYKKIRFCWKKFHDLNYLLVVGGVNVVLLIHNFGISLWLAFTLNEDNVPTWSNEAKSNSARSLYARSRYSRSGKFFNLNNYNFIWLFDKTFMFWNKSMNFNNISILPGRLRPWYPLSCCLAN